MLYFSTIDNRCLHSLHMLISGQFKHGYPLNISCRKFFDSCKIKRMVTNLTQPGYVNNYDKNRYLEKISKAAVHWLIWIILIYECKLYQPMNEQKHWTRAVIIFMPTSIFVMIGHSPILIRHFFLVLLTCKCSHSKGSFCKRAALGCEH